MTKTLKRPEVLSPAGTLEKLKVAVQYGADAVFIGGQAYGLRSRAGNFTFEQMEEGVQFAAKYGAKVYVAANMVMHEGNEAGAGEWFRKLRDIGIAAVIVSDPALIMIAATEAPGLEIHLSTQASATNYETLEFWKELGLTRVVLAREVSMEELAEIRKRTDVEIEAFVHGAMCISYSGRCTLSNHMSMRDANRGGCSQSCRWKYDLYDMPFGKERKSLQGEIPEEFSMSAVDMSMIDHIPDMIENGVDSLKIEGRMKSIHYVSTVTNCYKAAVDAYLESSEKFEAIKQDLVDEMWKVAQRELATGFYYGTPSENEQLFGARRKIPEYKFVAEVVSYDDATQTATIRQRNVINEGDQVEFYGPGFRHFETYIEDLHDAKGNKIDRAPNPMELLTIKVPQPVQAGDMVRALKEGLINLYKEDGTSVTVRLKSLKLSNKTWWTRCGRLPNVNWLQDFTMVHHLKMSSCLVLAVKFLSTSLSLKWFLMMMRHKQQQFVNEMSLTKGTKLSFMVQVSVILKPILKICMMPKAIKSTALQIQWNY
ncbi:U32 family peptidase [Streptococcus pneumoniae]|nr:U32 family peptidase [Streptococcus pneumoniae]